MVDVALKGELLHSGGVLVVGLVDGTLQSVLGHIASTGVLHQKAQTGVAVWVGTTLTYCNSYLFQDVGILFGALGICCTFGSLNL